MQLIDRRRTMQEWPLRSWKLKCFFFVTWKRVVQLRQILSKIHASMGVAGSRVQERRKKCGDTDEAHKDQVGCGHHGRAPHAGHWPDKRVTSQSEA